MIKLDHISKEFNSKIIFTNFSYQFNSGFKYALIGTSGSGKTTLLDIIGLIEKPTSGNITFNNILNPNLDSQAGRKLLRLEIGYLFQSYGLLEQKSIKNNLKYCFVYQKISKNEQNKQMINCLNQVQIYQPLNTLISTLRGGEKQRVAIAKLLLKNPNVIICDEPTANLDSKTEQTIISLLFDSLTSNQTLIIATHNLEIANMCDFIINVNKL